MTQPPITLEQLPARSAVVNRLQVHDNDWRTPITAQKASLASLFQKHSLDTLIPVIPYLSFIPRDPNQPQYVETGYMLTPQNESAILSALQAETGAPPVKIGWETIAGDGWFIREVEAGECVKLVHEGSYMHYPQAWGRVFDEISKQGRKIAGVPEQRVLMDYREVKEEDLRSELIVPVKVA
ncbi:hypothetical protein HDV00_003999 [Rhizophlyctis rosea]|nr:hypothetical protein HDV00_003999 [Rhizophlyctis rosea]